METKVYVGQLSFDTTEEELRDLFSQAGTVVSINLIKDRDSGVSKGFAFVEMSSQNEMEEAIRKFNSSYLNNQQLRVDIARPRAERNPGGGSGNYRGKPKKSRGGSRRY
jgi:RNA recognition motif-containing protein